MGKQRDYAAEYKRRVQRGRKLGYSASVSRGHPSKKIGEIGIKRARDMLLPGPVSVIRRRPETRHGFRPSYSQLRKRLESLNLKFLTEAIKGKRGRIPRAFVQDEDGETYMRDDKTRNKFIDYLTRWGFTTREAYTLWFSP